MKRVLTWYYNWKLSRNQSKLKTLKDQKRKLLDQVMETETYKSAKIILEKYAPDQLRKSSSTTSSMELTPVKPIISTVTPGTSTYFVYHMFKGIKVRSSLKNLPGAVEIAYVISWV